MEGKGVEKYLNDLSSFDTVIMGRNTYEFGYNFGLKAGQPAYPNMLNYIFSHSLEFDNHQENVRVKKMNIDFIKELKNSDGSDIYLCGGGAFAGWLLDNQLIDFLKIKLNPIIIGTGTKIFGPSSSQANFNLKDQENFDDGLQILTYEINI